MKKFIFMAIAFVGMFAACGQKTTTDKVETLTDSTAVDSTQVADTTVVDSASVDSATIVK